MVMAERQAGLRVIEGVFIFAVAQIVSIGVTLLVAGYVSIKTGALISALTLAGVALVLLAGACGNPLSWLGRWRVPAPLILLSIAASLAILPVSMTIEAAVARRLPIPEEMVEVLLELLRADNLTQLAYVWLVAALGAAASEELVFRGILQRSLSMRMKGWYALLITSLIFSLLHTIWRMAPIFVVSVYLGLLYLWTDSLVPPMVAHLTVNTSTVIMVWLTTRAGVASPAWILESKAPPLGLVIVSTIIFGVLLLKIREMAAASRTQEEPVIG
ncbi:MAG TPA: CPBP family intramembrane metalloprotease [Firmicutes bacterium]|nr:CPBP family intramembrane metalloprotease [Bacillota bacterium]